MTTGGGINTCWNEPGLASENAGNLSGTLLEIEFYFYFIFFGGGGTYRLLATVRATTSDR